MTLRVVAHLRAKPDRAAETRELLRGLVAPTHQEPGCIGYELLESIESPSVFTFVEEWRDEADLESHFGTPHILAALERFDDLMAEPLDLRKYRTVG